jgi:hypothetical protein
MKHIIQTKNVKTAHTFSIGQISAIVLVKVLQPLNTSVVLGLFCEAGL